MEIFELPLELIQKIFFNLDTQGLTLCAIADSRFAEIIYSSHFLDEYCRISFDCNVITAADVCNVNVALPFEFWRWVYTATKLEESDLDHVVYHSKYLTKIATLKHMYIMWLVCGTRSNCLYSYALMNEFYLLPSTAQKAFVMPDPPCMLVNDVLTKVFIALPGIMDLTCSTILELFSMQKGGSTSLQMDIVRNDGINPRLPIGFNPLFSVEIVTSPMFGKSSALLLLINEDCWVLWIGYLTVRTDGLGTSIGETCFSKYFSHSDRINEIRFYAQNAIQEVNSFIYNLRENVPWPMISYPYPETTSLIVSIAQQHHTTLCKKIDYVLHEHCSKLVNTVTLRYFDGSSECKEKITKILNYKISENVQLNNYVMNLLKIDVKKTRKLTIKQHFSAVVIKNLVVRLALLFRNEIHSCMENRFCHYFLCGCVANCGGSGSFSDEHADERMVRCLSDKMKDNVYLPNMWPPHVLSAACHIVPSLISIMESDVQMILNKGFKYVVPAQTQKKLNYYLKNAGLVLTHRPPTKPRCPPLFRQVRLWCIESLS